MTKSEALRPDGWIPIVHAHSAEKDWEKLKAESARWIGPVRLVDEAGLAVREFHPATEAAESESATCARCGGRGTVSTENIIGDPTWDDCPSCAKEHKSDPQKGATQK